MSALILTYFWDDFIKLVLIFQKMRFLKNCRKIAFMKKIERAAVFLITCIIQVTRKLKCVEKKIYRKQYAPKITFLPFFSKDFRMTINSLKIAAKIIFISRKIYLNIQNLEIIPDNQKEYKFNMVRYFCSSAYKLRFNNETKQDEYSSARQTLKH